MSYMLSAVKEVDYNTKNDVEEDSDYPIEERSEDSAASFSENSSIIDYGLDSA